MRVKGFMWICQNLHLDLSPSFYVNLSPCPFGLFISLSLILCWIFIIFMCTGHHFQRNCNHIHIDLLSSSNGFVTALCLFVKYFICICQFLVDLSPTPCVFVPSFKWICHHIYVDLSQFSWTFYTFFIWLGHHLHFLSPFSCWCGIMSMRLSYN